MSADNTTDRLLADARAKTARDASPLLGKISVIVGVIALLTCLAPVVVWPLGGIAVILGGVAMLRPASAAQGRIGLILGILAIFAGVFVYNLLSTGMISFG